MTGLQIQCLLLFLGFSPGEADGVWGTQTARALRQFQAANRLTADGIPGPETLECLRNAVIAAWEPEDFWTGIRYFTPAEFACQCGRFHEPYCSGFPARMSKDAVQIAEDARIHFGRPGHVVSGLRCPRHNRDCGGVKNSQHMAGEAVDLRIDGVTADQLLSYLRSHPSVRYTYKINETNVHFDIPPRG